MISVIIPVVNESETVGRLVRSALAHEQVEEVIVVDDGSIDDTPELARQAGARVLTSTFLGKGASLQDGMNAARSKVVLFLDACLQAISPDVITRLTQPVIDREVEVTKANIAAGRIAEVCRLTARPLLQTFFPELHHIEHPLCGTWAARRSLLQKFPFESDRGVEIGLLLDAHLSQATIREIDIRPVDIKEEPDEPLELVAVQVTRTILDRAAKDNRLKAGCVSEFVETSRHDQADLSWILHRAEPAERVALFDMDGVLVRGSFILELAYQVEKGAELAEYLDDPDLHGDELTQKIAALFSGIPRETFDQVVREMPLMDGARETVTTLRKHGFLVGIVSDSFQIVAETIRRRVLADFSIAHLMRFKRGKSTGRITFAPAMAERTACAEHPHCKANIIPYLTNLLDISPDRILAVGNSENDVCMLREAGQSVAFRPKSPGVRAAAEHVLEGALVDLLTVVEGVPILLPE